MNEVLQAAQESVQLAKEISATTVRSIKQTETVIQVAKEALELAKYWQARAEKAEAELKRRDAASHTPQEKA